MFVLFTCKSCGVTKKKVVVQSRKADESLESWMRYVAATVGREHQCVSPKCKNRSVDLAIPVGTDKAEEALRVGEEPSNVPEPEGD